MLVAAADLVIGMAREHVREVAVLDPTASTATFTLKELVRGASVRRGPRRRDESLADWLARLGEGRRRDRAGGRGPRRRPSTSTTRSVVAGPTTRSPRTLLDELLGTVVALAWPAADAPSRTGAERMKVGDRGRPRRRGPQGAPRRRSCGGWATRSIDLGTHGTESVDYPPICAAVGRAVRRRRAPTGASCSAGRARASRSPPTRCTACAPRSATTSTRRGSAGSTTTPTCWRWAAASSPPAWPARSSSSGSPPPFDGGRHERRVAQIADIETEQRSRRHGPWPSNHDDEVLRRSSTARSSARTPRSS